MNSNNNQQRGKKRARIAQPQNQPPAKRAKQPKGRSNSNRRGNSAFSAPDLHFAPVAVGAKMKKSEPLFEKNSKSQRIIHREKIAKVVSGGTGVFAVLKTIALNPGVAASFPWLANEAAGYESYRFNRLRYVWIPSIGAAVAGNVIMGPDYDAADAAPVGEAALSSYTDSDEERIWAPLAVECTPEFLNGQMARKFVRNGALAAGLDVKMYDSGNFFLAVTDDAAAQTGKLWVEYDVSLFNPQVPPGGFFSTSALVASGGSIAAATPFGAAPVVTGAPVLSGAASSTLTITGLVIGQRYMVQSQITGTVITAFTVAAGVGVTIVTNPATTQVNAAQTGAGKFVTFDATAETGTLVYTVTATTVTANNVVCTVLAPNPGF